MDSSSHRIFFRPGSDIRSIPDASVDLIVTSPPYPMIEMWDKAFNSQDQRIERALSRGEGVAAFEAMHELLDTVWKESYRALAPGGFACINIGDATRTIDGNFRLYSNHSRIISFCTGLGFQALPPVLWRKETNGPTKFMGSGMLPAGAYVTLEHEYILIFRKGGKKSFSPKDRQRRRESAFFWEERNKWFSDVWEIKGVRQDILSSPSLNGDSTLRNRSAAFPFEIPYRLINMYSLLGDTVLDPFLGTGTTTAAAIAAGRNSLGFELDRDFSTVITQSIEQSASALNNRISRRLEDHYDFLDNYRQNKGKTPAHTHSHYRFPVITRQEKELEIPFVESITIETPESPSPRSPSFESPSRERVPSFTPDLLFFASYREKELLDTIENKRQRGRKDMGKGSPEAAQKDLFYG